MLNKPVLSLPLKCNHAQNDLFRYSVPAASNIKKTVDALCFSPNHRETSISTWLSKRQVILQLETHILVFFVKQLLQFVYHQ